MRHLLLTTLLLSSIALAQDAVTEADETSLNRDESGNPIILKTNKLAAPTSRASQHKQTDLNFLTRHAEVTTYTPLSNGKHGDFSCPDGTEPSCLDSGSKVCPGSTKCIDDRATCFDEYPCDLSGGFVCESQYDDVLNEYKDVVRQYDQLASDNVALREKRLEQKNCVLNASNLEDAKSCAR
jgi:hypothetical protein